MKEEWKTIPEYSNYEASTLGNIRSKRNKILLKSTIIGGSYLHVRLYRDIDNHRHWKSIHSLIAMTFLNKEEGLVINHKDFNPLNNNLSNLEYTSQSDNIKKSWENGRCEHIREIFKRPKTQAQKDSARLMAQELHKKPRTDRQRDWCRSLGLAKKIPTNWENKSLGIIEIGMGMNEMYRKYKLRKESLSHLRRGLILEYKGWRILEDLI